MWAAFVDNWYSADLDSREFNRHHAADLIEHGFLGVRGTDLINYIFNVTYGTLAVPRAEDLLKRRELTLGG